MESKRYKELSHRQLDFEGEFGRVQRDLGTLNEYIQRAQGGPHLESSLGNISEFLGKIAESRAHFEDKYYEAYAQKQVLSEKLRILETREKGLRNDFKQKLSCAEQELHSLKATPTLLTKYCEELELKLHSESLKTAGLQHSLSKLQQHASVLSKKYSALLSHYKASKENLQKQYKDRLKALEAKVELSERTVLHAVSVCNSRSPSPYTPHRYRY